MIQPVKTPEIAISHLDHLWFQVAGTLCNLSCHHCFISCHPKNHNFGFLSLAQGEQRLQESVKLGVKEYYFTGGEPFLNPDMVSILVRTLDFGPATVLTNGTVFKDRWLKTLQQAEQQSLFSLEFRVSIDGFTAETNDPIRGAGTFDRAIRGVTKLVEHGFMPIITAARTWPDSEEQAVVENFLTMLRNHGYQRPRLKVLPTLKLGEEENRSCGYRESERITSEMMEEFDTSQLICEHSRLVTDRGVQICPILLEAEDAKLGETLQESMRPYPLSHGACFTCYQYGSICSNPSSGFSAIE